MSEGTVGIERLFRRLDRLERNMTNEIERPMKAAGTYVIGSVRRNFKEEGRPSKWTKLAASTIRSRRRGRGRGGVKIQTDTGALANSQAMQVSRTQVQVGTNKVQAKRLHFGYPGGTGRGHAKTPARPFEMLQEEDYPAIGRIFSKGIFER